MKKLTVILSILSFIILSGLNPIWGVQEGQSSSVIAARNVSSTMDITVGEQLTAIYSDEIYWIFSQGIYRSSQNTDKSPMTDAGAFLTGSYNADGDYITYSYTVDNTSGDFDIFAWSLEFTFSNNEADFIYFDIARGGDINVPTGTLQDPFDDWEADPGIPLQGMSAIDFTAKDPFGSADILAGTQLNGYSFSSLSIPGMVTYFLYGSEGQVISGEVMGPVAIIPEPSVSSLLVVFGFLIIAGLQRTRVTRRNCCRDL